MWLPTPITTLFVHLPGRRRRARGVLFTGALLAASAALLVVALSFAGLFLPDGDYGGY